MPLLSFLVAMALQVHQERLAFISTHQELLFSRGNDGNDHLVTTQHPLQAYPGIEHPWLLYSPC